MSFIVTIKQNSSQRSFFKRNQLEAVCEDISEEKEQGQSEQFLQGVVQLTIFIL